MPSLLEMGNLFMQGGRSKIVWMCLTEDALSLPLPSLSTSLETNWKEGA